MPDHQIIKEHFDRGQMLLDRLRRTGMLFDIGRHVHRGDQPQIVDVLFGPAKELVNGSSNRTPERSAHVQEGVCP
jgi:hypothetical protein